MEFDDRFGADSQLLDGGGDESFDVKEVLLDRNSDDMGGSGSGEFDGDAL